MTASPTLACFAPSLSQSQISQFLQEEAYIPSSITIESGVELINLNADQMLPIWKVMLANSVVDVDGRSNALSSLNVADAKETTTVRKIQPEHITDIQIVYTTECLKEICQQLELPTPSFVRGLHYFYSLLSSKPGVNFVTRNAEKTATLNNITHVMSGIINYIRYYGNVLLADKDIISLTRKFFGAHADLVELRSKLGVITTGIRREENERTAMQQRIDRITLKRQALEKEKELIANAMTERGTSIEKSAEELRIQQQQLRDSKKDVSATKESLHVLKMKLDSLPQFIRELETSKTLIDSLLLKKDQFMIVEGVMPPIQEISFFLDSVLEVVSKIQSTREELKAHKKSLKAVVQQRTPILENLDTVKQKKEAMDEERCQMERNIDKIPIDTNPTKSEFDERVGFLRNRSKEVTKGIEEKKNRIHVLKKTVANQISQIKEFKDRKEKEELRMRNEKDKLEDLKRKMCFYLEVPNNN